jgi:hypothetical protein
MTDMKSKYTKNSPQTPQRRALKKIETGLSFKSFLGRFTSPVQLLIVTILIIYNLCDPLSAAQYGKTILAFYKSNEGFSENKNPVKTYLEPEIKKMGLEIQYVNFDSGMPSKDSLKNARAILTWFNTGVVENKKKGLDYIEFLKSALETECKLVFLNSFGAYGYKEGGVEKWDLVDSINQIFKKMGFSFKGGFWTDIPAKLHITEKDSDMTEKEAKQDVNISRHYQQIIPLRDDVITYLNIKRTDKVEGLGDGNSSVILTSSNGGFALETYVLSGNKLMLNAPEFLRKALFYDDQIQDVCVIIGDLKNKKSVKNNLNYAFKYAKIHNTYIDAEKLEPMIGEDLLPYNVVIIATETLNNIPYNLFKDYLNKGGHIIFAKAVNPNNQFRELLGIKEYGGTDKFKAGFSFEPDFFMNGISLKAEEIPVTVRRAALSNCKVLASVLDKDESQKYPVLWEKTFGKGSLLYWNTDLLLEGDKGFRGALIQSIHYIYSGFITGTANIGMMMIDDLPAPLWNMNYREYRTEYYKKLLNDESNPAMQEKIKSIIKNLQNYSNITDTNFIQETWIKDIESLEKQFGFKYSTFLIFNYNQKTVMDKNDNSFPIEDFYLSGNNAPVKLGQKILNNGWEMGFHGYNHQSLTLIKPEHYESLPWPDKKTMVKALSNAKDEWITLFGEYLLPFTYVAPHNIIDQTGMSAIAEVFPSITVLSTLYVSDMGEIEQEFEWTSDRRFFQIPRISSGYIIKASNKYYIYDALLNFGVISHFIHPDDVFDEARSSGFTGWNSMKTIFTQEFTLVKKCYPAIRWMTTRDAFEEFQFYNSTNIRVREQGKNIIVESSDGSERYLFFRLRLKKGQKIKTTQNCQIVNANNDTGDIILKTTEHISKIVLN